MFRTSIRTNTLHVQLLSARPTNHHHGINTSWWIKSMLNSLFPTAVSIVSLFALVNHTGFLETS